jgi:peptide/nickel transport system substrate-binding protein
MKNVIALLAMLTLALTGALARDGHAQALTLVETPSLADDIAASKLPPIAERVPQDPLIVRPAEIGKPGDALHLLMASAKDTRMMVVYGYARLMVYTPDYKLEPDILQSVDVEGGRFTLHLRRGHKWSDGEPFTAEDFRYWFEDVASNKKLSPSGLPEPLLVEGKGPVFEVIDPETVRYSWPKPNPLFLPALAAPEPVFIYAPAHYLKRFHEKYAEPDRLAGLVKDYHVRSWAALHTKLFHPYHNDNPELPTLDPWVLATKPPAERFVFNRNPYFHRIDPAGYQLPYLDRVDLSIADSKIIPAKTGAGESDLQARYLRFDNYTFLKEAEEREDYKVRLWRTAPASYMALYPNLNVEDPVWRGLMRDVRFRRALSLAIDRHEINQVIYYGLAIEGQNTVLPGSPLYEPQYRTEWASFDLKQARKLLDEIGLTKRDSEGIRLLPDGRPLEIVVENAGESTEESDVLELIRDTWREAGIRLFSKPSQVDSFRRRVYSGETMMSIGRGYDNGLPTADMPPWEFAPTTQAQLQWPRWGQYVETKGRSGEACDMPAAMELRELYQAWFDAPDERTRAEVWHKMLAIQADRVFTIGLIAGVLQPVVVTNRLHNVPEEGTYNFDPGAFFGVYHMDTFWLTPSDKDQAAAPEQRG